MTQKIRVPLRIEVIQVIKYMELMVHLYNIKRHVTKTYVSHSYISLYYYYYDDELNCIWGGF